MNSIPLRHKEKRMSRILVVDDERGVRESLNILLSEDGHAIDLASNGLEALNYLVRDNYDLVLTDIRMPDMDGIALMKTIKEKWNERIPVIIITADTAIPSAVAAVKEGAIDFITKPFEIDRLRAAVNTALKNEEENLKAVIQQQEQETRQLKQMNQKLDHAVFELAILHEIGKTINSTLEINKIVSIILEMARQALHADRARLLLYHQENREATLDLAYSVEEAHHQNYAALDKYVIDWVLQSEKPLLLEDLEKLSYFKSHPEARAGLVSLMVVPFKRKNRVIGVMLLANRASRPKFQDQDFQFTNTLANQASIAIENAQLYAELQDHFTDTIRALITAVETKDAYTFGHSDRVTRYSLMIARQLGFNQTEMRRLEYLSLLHDIGKIGIEEKILRKPSKLNEQEWQTVKNHAALGGSIVKPIKFLRDGEKTIRHHHEWFNGTGYPDGLEGNTIPLFSRIIAVADAFDAMTSMRPYRDGQNPQWALAELQRCAGEQFDPLMVELFTNAYNEKMQSQE